MSRQDFPGQAAAQRDDEQRADYLTCCPDFIAEVVLNDEECTAAASAISDGDMSELGRIFLRAAEREASERIAVQADECGITPGEAAARLYGIYRPAGNKAVAA